MQKLPLVSILVRTCGRPKVLKECLESIKNQTYPNIEVCVVEDGASLSEALLSGEFSGMSIKYKALGEKKGRSVAGNEALALASGEYLNFLDDDDLFYEKHVEIMVQTALTMPEQSIFYAKADEAVTDIQSTNPYVYETISVTQRPFLHYSKENLLVHNIFPIQTVFFKREVYEAHGGFRTDLEYLEDWELWLKYAGRYEFVAVEETTSLYRVPANRDAVAHREALLKQNETEIRQSYVRKLLDLTEPSPVPDATQNRTVRYAIDSMSKQGSFFIAYGWCCMKNVPSETASVFVLLTMPDETKRILPAFRYDRPDIETKYNDLKYRKSGFFVCDVLNQAEYCKAEILVCHDGKFYRNRQGKLWQKLFGFNK